MNRGLWLWGDVDGAVICTPWNLSHLGMSCAMLSLESAGWTMRVPSGPRKLRRCSGGTSPAKTVPPSAGQYEAVELRADWMRDIEPDTRMEGVTAGALPATQWEYTLKVGPEASATSSTEGATGALALPAAPALLPEPGPGRSEDDRRRSMVLTGAGIQAGERFRKNHRLDIRGRPDGAGECSAGKTAITSVVISVTGRLEYDC